MAVVSALFENGFNGGLMSHEIDQSTGEPAIAYVGEKPWHKLGEELPHGKPIEEWLRAARLQWGLMRLPVQYLVGGRFQTMDDRFVLVRSDTNSALSIVSGDYQIVQPQEVLEFYRDLVSQFGYELETAGALDGGRKVWALAKTGLTAHAGSRNNDGVAGYLLLATSCDKTLATTAAFTAIRVVCKNTLFFAQEDVKQERRTQIKIPHNFRFDEKDVKERLGIMGKSWAAFMDKVQKMVSYHMPLDVVTSFVSSLLTPKNGKMSPKLLREKETIMALLSSAPGQDLESAKGTLWGILNAITYYVDHVRSGTAADRLDSAWFGSGNALKEKAWIAADAKVAESVARSQ